VHISVVERSRNQIELAEINERASASPDLISTSSITGGY